jgi:hypothetical protein
MAESTARRVERVEVCRGEKRCVADVGVRQRAIPKGPEGTKAVVRKTARHKIETIEAIIRTDDIFFSVCVCVYLRVPW